MRKKGKLNTIVKLAVPKDHLRRVFMHDAAKRLGSHQEQKAVESEFQASETEKEALMTIDEQIQTGRIQSVPPKKRPPLSGDYTPRAQEDIDDSLYVYGKHGPQPQSPNPTVSNASSIVFSICPSNDSDGELGAVSDSSTHYSTLHTNDSDGKPRNCKGNFKSVMAVMVCQKPYGNQLTNVSRLRVEMVFIDHGHTPLLVARRTADSELMANW
ncbi:hypothetical protein Tco_0360106 [Tanacetum coccineum]